MRATAHHFERDRRQIQRWIEAYQIDLSSRSNEDSWDTVDAGNSSHFIGVSSTTGQ